MFRVTRQDADNIYLEANITNTNPNAIIPCSFSESRFNTIVDNPEEFYLNVITFKVGDGSTVPIFFFEPEPQNQGNLCSNVGTYKITFGYNGTYYSENIIYNPTILYPPPSSWNGIDSNNASYYSVDCYQRFLNMINQCFQNLYSRFQAVASTAPPYTIAGGSYAPFLEMNNSTNIISLFTHTSFCQAFVGAPTIQIFFNFSLYNFFRGALPYQQFNGFNVPNGTDVQLEVDSTFLNRTIARAPILNYANWQSTILYQVNELVFYNNQNWICTASNQNQPPFIGSPFWNASTLPIIPYWNPTTTYTMGQLVAYKLQYYESTINGNTNMPPDANPTAWISPSQFDSFQIESNYNCLYRWNSITSLAVISQSLPTRPQSVSSPQAFNNVAGSMADSTQQVLTDFTINSTTGVDLAQGVTFYNNGQFRYIDLLSQTPIRKFDFQITMTTKDGLILQVALFPFGTSVVKIHLQRRGLGF